MRRLDARWADVRAGDYVKDKTGKMWRVERWDHIQATLADKDGVTAKARPNAYAKVERYVLTIDDALKTLAAAFPGVEIIEDRRAA